MVTGRSLKAGKVEVVTRQTKESQEIEVTNLVETLKNWLKNIKSS
ncbi:Prolyl-tRNA synthetase |uniref:Prolyl-tRNA synthetase \|nr:Prolyl-tRNA synthetase \